MIELTSKEKNLLAFSLFTMAMRVGPSCFETVEVIIEKSGAQAEFMHYAGNWIEYASFRKAQQQVGAEKQTNEKST